jgi:hypothetical protein
MVPDHFVSFKFKGGRRGRDGMIVAFLPTYAIQDLNSCLLLTYSDFYKRTKYDMSLNLGGYGYDV